MITAIELGQISAMHKQAKLDPALANALGLGGAGALVGGGLGALGGALRPAEDENGKSKGILRRMLGGGLSGATTGGLIGGSVGALGTELTRPIMSAALKGQEAYSTQKATNLANEPTSLSNFFNRAKANTAALIAAQAHQRYNSSSRANQHAFNSTLIPRLYDNPLSRTANQVADYLNLDNIASKVGKEIANEKPSKSKSIKARVDANDGTTVREIKQ